MRSRSLATRQLCEGLGWDLIGRQARGFVVQRRRRTDG